MKQVEWKSRSNPNIGEYAIRVWKDSMANQEPICIKTHTQHKHIYIEESGEISLV
jgi:hypothetical protein